MASTYSALKIELLETGANSGTWGTATNVNLGDAVLGEAITGQATVDFATDADVTITLTDSATTQAARNLRLNITESSTGIGSVRNLILGSGCQIEKFYLINNTGTGAKTVKNTSGTGITVPAGKATLVFNNGTNVVDAASYFTSLTLGSALPVASGGTGLTAGTSGGVLAYTASGTLASSAALTQYGVVYGGGAGAVPVATAAGTTGQVLTATTSGAPSWASPATSGTVTAVSVVSANGLAGSSSGGATPALTLSTSITGVLKGNGTAISAATAGTDYVTPTGTETLTNKTINGSNNTVTNISLTAGVTGTLPIANGGTNSTATPTAGGAIYGTGTAYAVTAAGTTGQYLKSNGASAPTWVTPSGGATVNTYTSSGTWTKPSGATFVQVECWGAGGGGGGGLTRSGAARNGGGGGGGGAYITRLFTAAGLGSTETVTVGAGGPGGITDTNGTAGGDTTFGTSYTYVFAGGGGLGQSSNSPGKGGGLTNALASATVGATAAMPDEYGQGSGSSGIGTRGGADGGQGGIAFDVTGKVGKDSRMGGAGGGGGASSGNTSTAAGGSSCWYGTGTSPSAGGAGGSSSNGSPGSGGGASAAWPAGGGGGGGSSAGTVGQNGGNGGIASGGGGAGAGSVATNAGGTGGNGGSGFVRITTW